MQFDKHIENILKEACWKNYKQVGTKKKGKKIVPNCLPKKTKRKKTP